MSERINGHYERDKNSHLLKQAHNKKHTHVWVKDFSILSSNYSSSEMKKKRENKPLNTKEFSIKLNLFI